jgi:hypothetical protein
MTGIWSDLIFWIGFALLAALVAMMILRRLYREFPFLFAYFVVEIAVAIVRRSFLVSFSALSMQYFYAYWISEGLVLLASFAVLYEVFLVRLFPSFHTTPVYRYLFPAVILLGVFLAVFAFLSAPRHARNMLSVLVGRTSLALALLQVVLVVFFSLAVTLLGGGWKRHEFGIVLGYGVYAASMLVTTAVRAQAGYVKTSVDQLPRVGYLAALVIWLIYLSREYQPESWQNLLRDLTEGSTLPPDRPPLPCDPDLQGASTGSARTNPR